MIGQNKRKFSKLLVEQKAGGHREPWAQIKSKLKDIKPAQKWMSKQTLFEKTQYSKKQQKVQAWWENAIDSKVRLGGDVLVTRKGKFSNWWVWRKHGIILAYYVNPQNSQWTNI